MAPPQWAASDQPGRLRGLPACRRCDDEWGAKFSRVVLKTPEREVRPRRISSDGAGYPPPQRDWSLVWRRLVVVARRSLVIWARMLRLLSNCRFVWLRRTDRSGDPIQSFQGGTWELELTARKGASKECRRERASGKE